MVTPSPDTARDLVTRIAAGNEPAFRQLFDLYSKRLFSFALAMTKSSADAEEIIQECFTRVWVQRHTLTNIQLPEAWLYRIVRNCTIDHLRKISREQKLINQVWSNISEPDRSLEDFILSREYQQLINQALEQLSPQKQQVYRLSREQDCSHEEIARITGLSKSRVNNILTETLKFIKLHLDKHSGEFGAAFLIWTCEQFR
ncbi:sigma-70 family RNA polymerase sigma factor [Pseudoflavitalea sp. G-6-1-2]|uniref:RNA polymerase sigma factor n=1 Tax=Pseudoflavitalea sp. G-6-1-2 TaxID=2728841 RepID=UPI00146EE773|nr:sigma-70 family RNA polymerase sigma factor [Pseudoflavitalea sp. G-6-1-2]NML20890.1 sigma-70 family RNA polymerase sigma factor [Pseudoflavitalea sp. G-6-1-2]